MSHNKVGMAKFGYKHDTELPLKGFMKKIQIHPICSRYYLLSNAKYTFLLKGITGI
jgi:hypothetical protein